MSACVFIGPTLAIPQAREILDADYLPPVRQGDVYRAVSHRRPRAIGIIDGYFHQVPSVWHKEILWAMNEGVHVFGSASMGALRAAELEPFGMQGVGHVFAAFRDGIIEDDDEVAVIHGPPETGFLAVSEAMVNIRRTLADAQAQAVVGAATRVALQNIAKALYYPKRGYAEILKRGADAGLPDNELSALRAWIADHRIDQKREDALAMLAAMGDLLARDPAPPSTGVTFAHTTMWAAATAASDDANHETENDGQRGEQEWLLDELRLDSPAYAALRHAALLRLLARREAERRPRALADDEIRKHASEFRMARGLHFGRDLDRWLAERDLDRSGWERLMEDEALVSTLTDATRAQLEGYIVDQLRTNGDYGRVAARARAKRSTLQAAENDRRGGGNTMEDLRALAWYFEEHLGTRLPDDVDAYAAGHGFGSTAAFQRAVVREHRFQLVEDKACNQ